MKKSAIIFIAIILFSSCNKKANESNTTEQKVNAEKTSSKKKVLFVVTSHDKLGDTGEKTGFWIEEFAAPYYLLKDNGIAITIVTPKGGQAPIDPRSNDPSAQTPATKRFNEDVNTQNLLANTLKLENVNQADFDGVFYPGGHGPLWDLSEDKNSIALIEAFYTNNKPVAAVCHAPAIFKHTKNTDGTPLVYGKKVTGFSNTEEEVIQLTLIVPFLLEDMLKSNGGLYSKKANWAPHAVEDGLLITGQNPASSEAIAELLLKQLK